MAARIRVLDDALADQIAAGEVVERPASVVKELIENAVDAGASRIDVEIEGGGCTAIRIADDGIGMCAEDAALSIRRHATSKLRALSDLQAIASLGFRGEALPSIASVCRFRLTTRERDAISGIEVQLEAGGPARIRDKGCAVGTRVEVRDLFFNVPARLNFVKSRATESGHVALVCTRQALAQPSLTLTLKSDERMIRSYLRSGSLFERASDVFAGEALVEIEGTVGDGALAAALGAPERARNGALGLHLLVNGRAVRDASLARAVAYAYGSVLPPGRYPIGVLHLRIPPDQVDVNVHPQKLEVRFRDGRELFERITKLLAKRLGTSAWSGPGRRDQGYWHERLHRSAFPEPEPPSPLVATALPEVADPWGLADAPLRTGIAAQRLAADQLPLAGGDGGFFGSLRVIGQVRRMLLICEGPQALYIVDQHAADERVCFHRLKSAYDANQVSVQQLLFPERIECTESEAALLDAQRDLLRRAGLDCSVLGAGAAAIHGVPMLLSRASPQRLLRDFLSELERSGERAFGAAVDRALATMACHAAIRAGDPLSTEQAQALLRSLDEVGDFAGHCPHGRPIVHAVRFDELERKLGR